MANEFMDMSESKSWRILVGAALRAGESQGWTLKRVPGRGRSNVWEAIVNGKTRRIAIRTTKDRWFAFPPLRQGKKWKTLNDVDLVLVAAVDDKEDPRRVEVYTFDAAEVTERFNANYAARTKAGQKVKDNFGMWVSLDVDLRNVPASEGSGLAEKHKPIAVFDIADLLKGADALDEDSEADGDRDSDGPATIAEVIGWARHRIADLSGVPATSVKLDLKIEY
jgi:hypothetical protein